MPTLTPYREGRYVVKVDPTAPRRGRSDRIPSRHANGFAVILSAPTFAAALRGPQGDQRRPALHRCDGPLDVLPYLAVSMSQKGAPGLLVRRHAIAELRSRLRAADVADSTDGIEPPLATHQSGLRADGLHRPLVATTAAVLVWIETPRRIAQYAVDLRRQIGWLIAVKTTRRLQLVGIVLGFLVALVMVDVSRDD